MYSWEIRQFIKERNYYVGGDDILKLISTKENPQLKYIKFDTFNNSYYICDDCGECFWFQAMPYEEAKKKNLVKMKKK